MSSLKRNAEAVQRLVVAVAVSAKTVAGAEAGPIWQWISGPCIVLTTSPQHRHAFMYSTAEPPVTSRSVRVLFKCYLEEHKQFQPA